MLTQGVPSQALRQALLGNDASKLLAQAFEELARCRLVLRNSYAFAFFVFSPNAITKVCEAHASAAVFHASNTQQQQQQQGPQPAKSSVGAVAVAAVGASRSLVRSGKQALKTRKQACEALQSELEMLTETLSEIVARRFMVSRS